jgi:hypothetical protein
MEKKQAERKIVNNKTGKNGTEENLIINYTVHEMWESNFEKLYILYWEYKKKNFK